MGRTGIKPGSWAVYLYRLIHELPNLEPDGLQGYDGHIRDLDPAERGRCAASGIDAVHALRDQLLRSGLPVPRLVMGGTPTFPIHARDETPGVECSPGTCVLHDAGYAAKFPDLPFEPAAVMFTRVVSKPRAGRICLDLGHKAIAADPVGPRLTLLGRAEATLGGQSEEHLVVDSPHADALLPGSPLLAIPTHICPTCALHSWAYVIEGGEVVDRWEVRARDRVLKF
jgi:D-serine deaminase-like pyridoxal phosphate-dependent protein